MIPAPPEASRRQMIQSCQIPYKLREDPGGAVVSATVPDAENERSEGSEKALRCRTCGVVVTSERERIGRAGQHLHTFFNPAGIVYEIGCFDRAPGCLQQGDPSDEFSWFAGYTWQVVICIGCLEHLGWYFSHAADHFFGLILTRLQEA